MGADHVGLVEEVRANYRAERGKVDEADEAETVGWVDVEVGEEVDVWWVLGRG